MSSFCYNSFQMPEIQFKENPINIARYDKLKALGKNIFDGVSFEHGQISSDHVERARKFITEGAKIVNPEVWATYWNHVIIAPELGRRIAEEIKKKTDVNPAEVEMLLWLHDIGRLVTPSVYFRNDLLGDRLLLKAGFPKEMVNELPPLGRLLTLADEMDLTEKQLNFDESLNAEQEAMLRTYFESLTPIQIIVNLVDDLGKRDKNGIFTTDAFLTYLKTQETRYDSDSPWASAHWATERRRESAVLVYHLVKKSITWLEDLGVDVGTILEDLKDYGPKFVLIVRHGELDNPANIVYNRDSVMDKPIHLSHIGTEQIQKLGDLIIARKFKPTKIFTSPETRAQESTRELNSKLKIPTEIVDDLDDVFAPYPYQQNWTMDKLIALEGNNYTLPDSEAPESVTQRMHRVFDTTVANLKIGEAAILLSHGDPIAFLANTLETDLIPDPQNLRKLIYPAKGQALVAVIGPNGKLFTLYSLSEDAGENTY